MLAASLLRAYSWHSAENWYAATKHKHEQKHKRKEKQKHKHGNMWKKELSTREACFNLDEP